MKFGRVDSVEGIDLSIPKDHPKSIFDPASKGVLPPIYVGCAKWNRQDIKGFYPRGTKDELTYYSTQFNSIELNAVFYNYSKEQITTWRDKTPDDFKFFPKVSQRITHWGRLKDVEAEVENYVDAIAAFDSKLGMSFAQLNANFDAARNLDRLIDFADKWPKGVELAMEVRNPDWYEQSSFFKSLERNDLTHVITDTAGRRDLMHMRLTNPKAFVRFVGANHLSDYRRLNEWVDRIEQWVLKGVEEINFFIHQHMEVESPLLAAHFINQLNERLGYELTVPAQS